MLCAKAFSKRNGSMNSVATPAPYPASAAALALHDSLFVADLHDDQLLWQREIGPQRDGVVPHAVHELADGSIVVAGQQGDPVVGLLAAEGHLVAGRLDLGPGEVVV